MRQSENRKQGERTVAARKKILVDNCGLDVNFDPMLSGNEDAERLFEGEGNMFAPLLTMAVGCIDVECTKVLLDNIVFIYYYANIQVGPTHCYAAPHGPFYCSRSDGSAEIANSTPASSFPTVSGSFEPPILGGVAHIFFFAVAADNPPKR